MKAAELWPPEGIVGQASITNLMPKWFRASFLIINFCFAAAIPQRIQAEILTNAAQVLSLPAKLADHLLPVRIKGIVTASEPQWGGSFFLQDESSGVFVDLRSIEHPEPGDVVELTGVTVSGAYAPIITAPKWKKTGTAPLPIARKVPIEQIMSGIEDGQRVEVVGIVRAVLPDKTNWDVDLACSGYRLHAFPKTPPNVDPISLIGAKVRIVGTVAASFNAALHQLVSVNMFVPLQSDFIIEEMESPNPLQETIVPLNSVAQYRRDFLPGMRLHVKGVVTLQRPGEDFFIEDQTGGLHVKSRQLQSLAVGDVVEAVGFPGFDNFLPVLEDAVFYKTNVSHVPVKAKQVAMKEIQDGLHHADLITLSAKVQDHSFRITKSRQGNLIWTKTTLMLQKNDQVFTAEVEAPQSDTTLSGVPIGSIIEVTGVCFTENGEDKRFKSLQLLLPDTHSFRLLQKPSWLTPRRLLIGLGCLLAILVVAVVWTVRVSKRNAILHELILEKELAQKALQEAHDLLDDRVKERTAQLKVQITARKESELVLTERTRLAQELHDTLEQSLTGIALQLDTTSKMFKLQPEAASYYLEMAREQVTQNQVEVRRSIWNLRSRVLEQFDLPGALVASGKQLMDGTSIGFKMTTTGRVRPLPEIIEDNLLRISQEAMANIVKHSQASSAEIKLDYGPQEIVLTISDNGCGFLQNDCAGPDKGHFGLQGISERAKRLNAQLTIASELKTGTLLTVRSVLIRNFNRMNSYSQKSPMKNERKIRVLIVDDHFVVRRGLLGVINTEEDMEVIAEASDGIQAVYMFEKFKPDLVLMDLRMPIKDGIAATAEICRKHPNTHVLMLTTFDGDTDIHRAIQAGARGYVLKNSTGADLIPAMRAVAAGDKWIPKEIATVLASRKFFDELTPRELQVLQQMAKGLENREISELFGITANTVKDHSKSILSKLHVTDRTKAVTVALQRGIIQLG